MKCKQLILVAIIFTCALILPVTIYVGITSRKAISTYTPAWERVIFEAKEDAMQPGTFFDTDNPRFVVVDCGTDFGGRDCIVYADTVSGTMYMVVDYYGDYVGFTLPSDVFQYDSDNPGAELIE